ncbi:MAG TPA: ABC transporter substrate-binding protein [Burkholderiales bacterium]|nr:ABC transporter substrate-binding protein [Burkholderiales bacterium]
MIPSPRHSLLGLLCLLPALACAQEPVRVKFTLDWVIDGQQAPFFLAQAKGYFAQQGLAVTLDAGAGSAAAVQRVAQGTYDMGYGDTSALIEHLSKTADPSARVQAVYLTQDATPAGFTTLKKLNISKPADLAGRSIGGPVFDSARKLFPIFARAQSIDPASVKWQNLQPGLNLTQLARGQLDAASGFPSLQVGQIEAMGVKAEELVLFNYKDYGVHIYGNAILANPKFMQEKPAAVAAFLRAYNHGLKDTLADPQAAIEFVHQREPTINVATELVRLRALVDFIATPNARTKGLSEPDKARLQRQSEDVARAFGLGKVPEADEIFTPRFLPPRAERML